MTRAPDALYVVALTALAVCALLALVGLGARLNLRPLVLAVGALLMLALLGVALFSVRSAPVYFVAPGPTPDAPLRAEAEAPADYEGIPLRYQRRVIPTPPSGSTPTGSLSTGSPTAAPQKPPWVDAPPALYENVYRLPVASDPKLTVPEAERDLEPKLVAAAEEYAANLLGTEAERYIRLDAADVRKHFFREGYMEAVQLSVGTMHRAHGLLEFGPPEKRELQARLHAARVHQRLARLAGVGLAMLAVLATAFGYLKLDTSTRGYYTGRLQLLAAALILGIAWAATLSVP